MIKVWTLGSNADIAGAKIWDKIYVYNNEITLDLSIHTLPWNS